jgi:hypothetical protein
MSLLLPREWREEPCPYCDAVRLHLLSHIAYKHPTKFTAWDRNRRAFYPSIFAQVEKFEAEELAREKRRDALKHSVRRFL